jgi:predicted nucleic acid-binding protein
VKPTLVVDCSIAMAWCFSDEGTDATSRVLDRLAGEAALVPALWFLEVANVLAMAEKRQRILPANSMLFVQLLSALDIQIDNDFALRAFEQIIPLCRSYALTAYDAAYLDLALRKQLPLATLDDDLRRAGAGLGIELLGQ